MFIIIVFFKFLTRSSTVSSQDFYCSLPRDQSRDVQYVTPGLGVFVILLYTLCSGYYYYDNVVIGVLRTSWFKEFLFWIGLLLSKDVKKLEIIILIILLFKKVGNAIGEESPNTISVRRPQQHNTNP